jgi:hypothetical protein
MEKLSLRTLELNEMEEIIAGSCSNEYIAGAFLLGMGASIAGTPLLGQLTYWGTLMVGNCL